MTDESREAIFIPPHDALKAAAELIERAAYELADREPTALVSELVMLASDLQQVMKRLSPPQRPLN